MGRPRKPLLTTEEIRRPFEGGGPDQFPAILSVGQVAAMLGVGVGTIRDWLLRDRLEGSYRKRGKRLFFWRDKVLDIIFNGKEWESDSDE